jgi:hypothetical protein
VRGRGFDENFKTEIELKKRVFLEKDFQHPIKSRKINWISAKITLINLTFLIT